jgi:hypothetical protein
MPGSRGLNTFINYVLEYFDTELPSWPGNRKGFFQVYSVISTGVLTTCATVSGWTCCSR